MRRKSILLSLVLFMVFTLVVVGCAPKETPAEEPEEGKLKVAAIFATPIEEPWDGCIHEALLKARAELDVDYEWAENISSSDFERVVREYADKGFDLIMGDAFGAEDAVRRVAKDYPEIAFAFGSGGGLAEPNFSVFDDWIHEPAYLSGMIAGKLTKTNILGVVGGIPVPEVNRIVNAFIEGAKEVNPDVKVKVSFIGCWFDPPKAKEAAMAQIDAGADVLYAERYGVIDACKERGVYAFGNMQDQNLLAPDVVVTGPIWNMYPTVKYLVESIKLGAYQAQDLKDWSMMGKGGAYLAPFYGFEDTLPADIIEMVRNREQEILNGTFRVSVDESTPKGD
jgi:basic membrane lipoprotein Med (substrate-binding protein (PBP1-ABC) superfamily)